MTSKTHTIHNQYGVEMNWTAVIMEMDEELYNELHAVTSPMSRQQFFNLYCAEHRDRLGEEFKFNKVGN